MQALERADAGLASLGDDLAGAVGRKFVDHDAVVAEQRSHLPRALAKEAGEVGLTVQTRHHRAHDPAGVGIVFDAGFGLDDDLAAGEMDRQVEGLAAFGHPHAKAALDHISPRKIGDSVPNVVDDIRRQEIRQRITDHRNGLEANEFMNVQGDARDEPIGADSD